ncbi:nitroreductase family protein [Gloeocapsopsis crepidinum]|uniref:hypothetical protein n=1 Tax=Gloeocapsopsis crepidinum TaxID=693223 RepID=UPI001D146C79|nr:hypothetical protein [Gloeocapsopsis crepidinum]
MCVGYPDSPQSGIKPRLPQPAVLHRETYDLKTQDAAIAQYNATIQTFYREQKMNVTGDWAEHSVKRIAIPKGVRLREALQILGFDLRSFDNKSSSLFVM